MDLLNETSVYMSYSWRCDDKKRMSATNAQIQRMEAAYEISMRSIIIILSRNSQNMRNILTEALARTGTLNVRECAFHELPLIRCNAMRLSCVYAASHW